MLETRFTELLGCTVPVQQAGMGDISSPRLAAAVAEAGGLGMVGLTSAPPEYVRKALDEARRMTSGVFGANFIVAGAEDPTTHELDPELLAGVEAAASRARVVEFFYDTPRASLVDLGHAGGALVSWQVGSLVEAVAAERAGCDLIVAQGTEAGGHVRGTIGLHALLAQILPAVKAPVVAAGGIGTGRAMAAALAAGASAVRVGTRFAAAAEAESHPRYVERLVAAEAKDTVLTEAFSGTAPDAPHRVLRSSIEAAERFAGDVVGERIRPWAPGVREPVLRFQGTGVTKAATGEIDAMSFWAGESVGAVRRVQSAGEIVRELAGEAEALLRRWER